MAKIKATRAQRHQRREAKAARRRRRLTDSGHRNYRGPVSRATAQAALVRAGEQKMGMHDSSAGGKPSIFGRIFRSAF